VRANHSKPSQCKTADDTADDPGKNSWQDPPKGNLANPVDEKPSDEMEEVRIESSPESKEPALGTQVTESSEERGCDIVPLFNVDSRNGHRLVVILAEREVSRGGALNRSKDSQEPSGVADLSFVRSISSALLLDIPQ